MATLFKVDEWQSPAGHWLVASTQDLAHNSGVWYMPARAMKISVTDFILMLRDKYHAEINYFNADSYYVSYIFPNYKDAHRFLLDVNKAARNNKFFI